MTTTSSDVPMKGLIPLLEALAKVRTERPDAHLVIIGKPKDKSRIPGVIERLGLQDAVEYVSGVTTERIVELYAEAEVAVVPSLYEGFSLPAIEAMACGVPLVATTGGALPEVVGTHEETGLLVPPDDPGTLAAMMLRALGDADLRARIGAAGRARALDRFTWRATAIGTVENYRALLDEPRPRPRHAHQGRDRSLSRAHRRLRPPRPARRPPPARHGLWRRPPCVRGDASRRHGGRARLRRGRAQGRAGDRRRDGRRRRGAHGVTGSTGGVVNGDALRLPFPDASFDRVIASEVLEHIWGDETAIAELVRVLRPGGRMAVTVPARFPERVCWALSHKYHDTPGGHVRIYRQHELERRLERAGLTMKGSRHVHALHSPYWWLRCAYGVDDTAVWPVRRYHDFLVWQIERQPRWVAALDEALNPVLGKSLVVYTQKVDR